MLATNPETCQWQRDHNFYMQRLLHFDCENSFIDTITELHFDFIFTAVTSFGRADCIKFLPLRVTL